MECFSSTAPIQHSAFNEKFPKNSIKVLRFVCGDSFVIDGFSVEIRRRMFAARNAREFVERKGARHLINLTKFT